jgi:hypothetical protein
MTIPGLRLRRFVACVASFTVGALLFHTLEGDGESGRLTERLFLDSVIVVPVVAAGLIWSSALVAQLLARGAWWSMLLVGGLIALTGGHSERHLGATIAICNAIALLAAAGSSMTESRGRFAPVAFRGTLLVALVLAIADAGAFTWFGIGNAIFDGKISVLLVVPLMLAGVIGLLRMRTWGLIVSLCTNLAIAILAMCRVLALPGPMRALFIGTAVLQLLVPIPMLIAIVRGRAPSPDSFRRIKIVLPVVMILAVVAISIYGAFVHERALVQF